MEQLSRHKTPRRFTRLPLHAVMNLERRENLEEKSELETATFGVTALKVGSIIPFKNELR